MITILLARPCPHSRRPAPLLDISHGGPVDARCPAVPEHREPRTPEDISADDLVPQRMKPSPGISLGRPVKCVLQGTNRIHRNRSHSGGASRNGTHRAPPSQTHTSTK